MSPTRALLEHVDTALIDTAERKPATTCRDLWADDPERGSMKGRATVAELVDHGLAAHPACVTGIGLRPGGGLVVLCRPHVNSSGLGLVGALPGDEAVLLVGGPGPVLAVWCSVCRGDLAAGRDIGASLTLTSERTSS